MATLRPGSCSTRTWSASPREAWRSRLSQRLARHRGPCLEGRAPGPPGAGAGRPRPGRRPRPRRPGPPPHHPQGRAAGPAGRGAALRRPGRGRSRRPGAALHVAGPIYDPQGPDGDFWRFRHALAAAGFRRGDVVLNSRQLPPDPARLHAGRRRARAGLRRHPRRRRPDRAAAQGRLAPQATAYLGTPSFLFPLLTRARETGTPLSFEVAFVIAEMLPESLRADIEAFGVRCLQGYGTADLGCLAYECPEMGGWHVHPEAIVEVLDLETGKRGRARAARRRWWRRSSTWPTRCSASAPATSPRSRRRGALRLRPHHAQAARPARPGGGRRQGEGDVRPRRPDRRR